MSLTDMLASLSLLVTSNALWVQHVSNVAVGHDEEVDLQRLDWHPGLVIDDDDSVFIAG
jgi:hypothetical protein